MSFSRGGGTGAEGIEPGEEAFGSTDAFNAGDKGVSASSLVRFIDGRHLGCRSPTLVSRQASVGSPRLLRVSSHAAHWSEAPLGARSTAPWRGSFFHASPRSFGRHEVSGSSARGSIRRDERSFRRGVRVVASHPVCERHQAGHHPSRQVIRLKDGAHQAAETHRNVRVRGHSTRRLASCRARGLRCPFRARGTSR